MRYKLTIAYDGTNYSGWQVQENATSIQALVQEALQTALRHPLDLTGAGRTDAGVHAKGQTAHFDTDVSTHPSRLLLSLNALLPPDIRIMQMEQVEATFHARYSAKSKIYHYHLHLDPILDPFTKLYSYQVFGRFDLQKLKKAAPFFIGTHNFTSFANVKKTNKEPDAIRTLYRLDVIEEQGGVRLEFEGDGFLYKMVRNITGTLLEIGAGKLSPEEIPTILHKQNRSAAGAAAQPHGLFLVQVLY
jgi:tRNA pseudouridine38-40 synthase